MNYGELKSLIDMEVGQKEENGLVSDGSYKTISDDQMKAWLRESLYELANINQNYWYRVVKTKQTVTSNIIITPKEIKSITRIAITTSPDVLPNVWNSVSFMTQTTSNSKFTWLGGAEIYVNMTVPKDSYIWIEGIVSPSVPNSDSDIIDFPITNERLLIVSILLKKASRDNIQTPFWYSEFKRLKAAYETQYGKYRVNGQYKPTVKFTV